MFIGHYCASFALKSYAKETPLGLLFIAAQLVDIIFFPLVFIGVEQLRIVPHFTASTHFELVFMPYTHSLLATFIWAALAYGVIWIWGRQRYHQPQAVALAVAVGVASHWFCDLLVHTPDLPLAGGSSAKFGFGIWRNALLTYLLEAGLLMLSLWRYYRTTRAINRTGHYGMLLFVALLLIINLINVFGPPIGESTTPLVISALSSYLGFAFIAGWLDKYRAPFQKIKS